ncbi:MAG: homoserine O-succinyltransferase [Defluviitaleaceae bacterium]|nr:homoserine O-succinyltransferase [Defluviitaleaceae bacterium]
MPVKIPSSLPAKAQLESENISVITNDLIETNGNPSVKVAILNLMPNKITTETQLLRLLGNSPFQVDIELIKLASHISKTTPESHINAFYKPFAEVESQKFDGFIITGAPIEHLAFEEVNYWDELCRIMNWTLTNAVSTLHICWGAQAALYHHYEINKVPLKKKLCGVFPLQPLSKSNVLTSGFDDTFYAPQSRWSGIDEPALKACPALEVLASSPEVGMHMAATRNCKQVFVLGHMEYDADTLANEFKRDIEKGLNPAVPHNYFPDDCPSNTPAITWRNHANLFFSNWLNYITFKNQKERYL